MMIFIIGFLIGAIVATTGFFVYMKLSKKDMPQSMEQPPGMENMQGEPSAKPEGENGEPPAKPEGENGNITYSAQMEISKDKDISNQTYSSSKTDATISLENNTFINNDSDGNFLRIQKDSWGKEGSNGGNVTLDMTNQEAVGNIVVDSISSLDISLSNKSYYEETINSSNEAKAISLKLDKTSKIKLSGDSYVTSLVDDDETYSNIDFNGYRLYVNGKLLK